MAKRKPPRKRKRSRRREDALENLILATALLNLAASIINLITALLR